MATYKEIQSYIKEKYGYACKPCWIAHAKEVCGLPLLRQAHNRKSVDSRVYPCPADKLQHIKEVFKTFGMLK